VDIHGQSEHLSLLRSSQHVEMLDRFSGTLVARGEVTTLVGALRDVLREVERLEQGRRDAARRLDLLNFQVEEITSANLQEGEEEELTAQRQVLSNAERLSELAETARGTLVEAREDAGGSVLDALGAATRALGDLVRLDPSQQPLIEAANEAYYAVEELGRSLSGYATSIEADPERLAEVEDRLDLIRGLQRKYGATIAEVVTFGQAAADDRNDLLHAEDRLAELSGQADELRQRIGAAASALSAQRRAGATRMVTGIERELGDLNMARARFAVSITQVPNEQGVPATVADESGASHGGVFGYDERGIDRVEFLISPNPGEDLKPLARIASGGEMARVMLALKTILSEVDRTGTLIFDEVDTGVGGRSGQVVGEKLRYLADDHQVLCITHLPQIAALGNDHFRIGKQVVDGRTRTEVQLLDPGERVEELAQMLGGAPVTTAARQAARELLEKGTRAPSATRA